MVWKIAKVCMIVAVLLGATATHTHALDIYTDGNISNTYTTIFEDVLNDANINDDYLYLRSGQYDYSLIVGDLTLENTTFKADTYKHYKITTTSGYNSTYKYTISNETNLDVNVSNNLVYSNLGDYPKLIERGYIYEYSILVIQIIFGLCFLIRPIFNFVSRSRNGI